MTNIQLKDGINVRLLNYKSVLVSYVAPITGFIQVIEVYLHCTALESPEIEVWVVESHGKTISFLRMNRKNAKLKKKTDKSENQLIPIKR